MTKLSFLVGMSAIAFASAASAQTTTNGDTTDASTGNRIVVSCTPNSNNNCSVDQGVPGDAFSSTGSVNVAGSNSTSTVYQRGNRQVAENRATGSYNDAEAYQYTGFSNTATINQTGSSGGSAALYYGGNASNFGYIYQGGSNNNANGNTGKIVQVRTAGAADSAGGNESYIYQAANGAGGFNNSATSTQNGTGLTSVVDQDDQGNGVVTSNNNATVLQVGRTGTPTTGTFSYIRQSESGNTANVSLYDGGLDAARNVSDVRQRNNQFTTGSGGAAFESTSTSTLTNANSPTSANLATIAITGKQNSSFVSQNGVQNTADVSMLNGGSGSTNSATGGTNPGTGVSLTPGSGGQPGGRPQGNSSTINQTGRGGYAAVSLGGSTTYADGTKSAGAGNISNVTQTQNDASVTATTFSSAQTATTAPRALVYQRGTLDSTVINQQNNTRGGASDGSGSGVQSGSLADVSQLSFNSTASVTQTGTNTGRVTQGSNKEPTNANNMATITQTDEGDITGGTSAGSGFGGGTAGSGTSRNFAEIAQNGILNSSTVIQDAINASASVFQASGTRSNRASVQQGQAGVTYTGFSTEQNNAQGVAGNSTFNTQNVTATINQTAGQSGAGTPANANGSTQLAGVAIIQNGTFLTATGNQSGGTAAPAGGTTGGVNSNNSILIGQIGTYNSASATQSGRNAVATVEQRGSGSATLQNLVTITQSGGTAAGGNVALARQTSNVGASGSTGATAGVPNDTNFPFSRTGANSAEIKILQAGVSNSATVEQRGKGQYASITQDGNGNTGGILQGTLATNAVAVLTQSGANTYYIEQTTAGQYVNVNQTGTGNMVVNGPSGPGNNQAGATPITFGGTQ